MVLGSGVDCRKSDCCPDKFGCCKDICPDVELRRHDTQPPLVVSVSDCNGPLNLDNTVVEVSMWAKAKLRTSITSTTVSFRLADDIGFEQSMPGDIILVNRVRSPEMMLVTGHDEDAKTITVVRAYHGTQAASYTKGSKIRIFRMLNAMGETHSVVESVDQLDGTFKDVITDSQLIYYWKGVDSCLPGCYYTELKLLNLEVDLTEEDPTIPSACRTGYGVNWVRRFPVGGEGYLVKIWDSPSSEDLQ